MAKELSRILPRFQTTAPSAAEAVELSTISAIVEHAEASEDDQPQNNDDSDSYSVGRMAGVLTILSISMGKIFALMFLHHR